MDRIRFFDIFFSIFGIIILLPFFIIIALCIKLTSKGSIIFSQIRVGKNNTDFMLYKFRTMYVQAEAKGQLTVGGRDNRITNIGFYLRKFKLDELPQLFNVLFGKMSLVGPRPEVRKYVSLYTIEQQNVLKVLPGITDYASLEFRNENDLLAKAKNPEEYYINEIMPKKIELNKKFIENRNIKNYFLILLKTIKTAVKGE